MPAEAQNNVSTSESQSSGRKTLSLRKWLKRGLFILASISIVGVAVTYIASATSKEESGPKLTHTVSRGNLVVTVTEQGTLESSNNTEIKCKVRGFSTVIEVVENGTVVQEGDVLVRLDTRVIEEAVSLTKTNTHIAEATLERTKADVAKSVIAIDAYSKGRYRSQMQLLQKEREVARRNLEAAEKMLAHSRNLFKRGYVTELEVEGNAFTVQQAELELKVKEIEISVLEQYTKEKELTTLRGNLTANNSKLEADKAGLAMEESLRDRAQQEFEACVIKAEKSGLVIYPSAAAWKNTPDIAEGATVRKDQVLLLMPDLTQMQAKVGIHESVVERIKPGMTAKITLSDKSDRTIEGKVASVAAVTKPAGWWTGNVVKYDTIIELPNAEGLKPGMTAEVEVVMAEHQDVLTIPVAAVLETERGDYCWVKTAEGHRRRKLQLGDSNDVFLAVKAGLQEGDEVVLNPLAFVDETEVLKPVDKAKPRESDSNESNELAASR